MTIPHNAEDYRDLKLRLDGYLQPGQGLYRNVLLGTLLRTAVEHASAQRGLTTQRESRPADCM